MTNFWVMMWDMFNIAVLSDFTPPYVRASSRDPRKRSYSPSAHHPDDWHVFAEESTMVRWGRKEQVQEELADRALGIQLSRHLIKVFFQAVHVSLPAISPETFYLDWELAGFKPAWLAARADDWFNEDPYRFIMCSHQDGPEPYDETESPSAREIRAYFREEILKLSPELHHHLWNGVELRAMWQVLCDALPAEPEYWLRKYACMGWNARRRGVFPFDLEAWADERLQLFSR